MTGPLPEGVTLFTARWTVRNSNGARVGAVLYGPEDSYTAEVFYPQHQYALSPAFASFDKAHAWVVEESPYTTGEETTCPPAT